MQILNRQISVLNYYKILWRFLRRWPYFDKEISVSCNHRWITGHLPDMTRIEICQDCGKTMGL